MDSALRSIADHSTTSTTGTSIRQYRGLLRIRRRWQRSHACRVYEQCRDDSVGEGRNRGARGIAAPAFAILACRSHPRTGSNARCCRETSCDHRLSTPFRCFSPKHRERSCDHRTLSRCRACARNCRERSCDPRSSMPSRQFVRTDHETWCDRRRSLRCRPIDRRCRETSCARRLSMPFRCCVRKSRGTWHDRRHWNECRCIAWARRSLAASARSCRPPAAAQVKRGARRREPGRPAVFAYGYPVDSTTSRQTAGSRR